METILNFAQTNETFGLVIYILGSIYLGLILLLPFLQFVVKLTKTDKDDKVVAWLDAVSKKYGITWGVPLRQFISAFKKK